MGEIHREPDGRLRHSGHNWLEPIGHASKSVKQHTSDLLEPDDWYRVECAAHHKAHFTGNAADRAMSENAKDWTPPPIGRGTKTVDLLSGVKARVLRAIQERHASEQPKR
jgi:hypothetical protein